MQYITGKALPQYWTDPDVEAMEFLKNSIDNKIKTLFADRRDVLFDVKRGFTRRIYYTQNGVRMDDAYVPGQLEYPEIPEDHDIDPIGRLIDRWGMPWEVKAYELTRPNLPIPSTVRELCPNPMLLYYAQRNGVSYLVIHTSIF